MSSVAAFGLHDGTVAWCVGRGGRSRLEPPSHPLGQGCATLYGKTQRAVADPGAEVGSLEFILPWCRKPKPCPGLGIMGLVGPLRKRKAQPLLMLDRLLLGLSGAPEPLPELFHSSKTKLDERSEGLSG
jgi:hypothetical protein